MPRRVGRDISIYYGEPEVISQVMGIYNGYMYFRYIYMDCM